MSFAISDAIPVALVIIVSALAVSALFWSDRRGRR